METIIIMLRNKSWNVTAPSYGNDSKVAIPRNPPSLGETRGEGAKWICKGSSPIIGSLATIPLTLRAYIEQKKIEIKQY